MTKTLEQTISELETLDADAKSAQDELDNAINGASGSLRHRRADDTLHHFRVKQSRSFCPMMEVIRELQAQLDEKDRLLDVAAITLERCFHANSFIGELKQPTEAHLKRHSEDGHRLIAETLTELKQAMGNE